MRERTLTAADLKASERQRCEVWTRVMGYHRPVSEFNPGKKGEHYERTHFIEPREARIGRDVCVQVCA